MSEIVPGDMIMLTLDPGVLEGEERRSGGRGGDSSADIQRAAQGPRPDTVSGQLCLVCTVSTRERAALNI